MLLFMKERGIINGIKMNNNVQFDLALRFSGLQVGPLGVGLLNDVKSESLLIILINSFVIIANITNMILKCILCP